jgi:hypothetical protein
MPKKTTKTAKAEKTAPAPFFRVRRRTKPEPVGLEDIIEGEVDFLSRIPELSNYFSRFEYSGRYPENKTSRFDLENSKFSKDAAGLDPANYGIDLDSLEFSFENSKGIFYGEFKKRAFKKETLLLFLRGFSRFSFGGFTSLYKGKGIIKNNSFAEKNRI